MTAGSAGMASPCRTTRCEVQRIAWLRQVAGMMIAKLDHMLGTRDVMNVGFESCQLAMPTIPTRASSIRSNAKGRPRTSLVRKGVAITALW
jgi:hypothetical protein